jgi:hypothetical protein
VFKLAASFEASYLLSWAQCTAIRGEHLVLREVFDAGAETLFNADSMKQMAENKFEDAFLRSLKSLVSTHPFEVVSILPRLFESFVQASSKTRGSKNSLLTAEGSLDLAKQSRIAALHLFGLLDGLLGPAADVHGAWRARTAMLEVVERDRLLRDHGEDASRLLRRLAAFAVETLSSRDASVDDVDYILESLEQLTKIDADVVRPCLGELLEALLCMVCLS